MYFFLVTADVGGPPLNVHKEREAIVQAVGKANVTILEQATLDDLIDNLPCMSRRHMVHQSGPFLMSWQS